MPERVRATAYTLDTTLLTQPVYQLVKSGNGHGCIIPVEKYMLLIFRYVPVMSQAIKLYREETGANLLWFLVFRPHLQMQLSQLFLVNR